MENKKIPTVVHCPNCKSTFDITEYIEHLKREFIKELEKLTKKLKGGKK